MTAVTATRELEAFLIKFGPGYWRRRRGQQQVFQNVIGICACIVWRDGRGRR